MLAAPFYLLMQNGKTPLFCAAARGQVAVVQLLLQKGADISICDMVNKQHVYFSKE